MSDLARALLDEIANDPVALQRLRELVSSKTKPRDDESGDLLTVGSTAKRLDCSPRTVRRRIADGSLPAVIEHSRLMVRGDDLRDYIEALDRRGGSVQRRRARPSTGRFDFLRE